MSIQQRQMLIHWANKMKGYIIEDDYDSEFRYTQQPFPALTSIDSSRVIYLGKLLKVVSSRNSFELYGVASDAYK